MAKVCYVCGKGPGYGNTVTRRGLAKSKGGVGKRTTGITKRRFLPNLQPVRIQKDGEVKKVQVCVKCIKAGKIEKHIKVK